MKTGNLVKSITVLCMALFLFMSLPCFENVAMAADKLEIKLNVNSQSIVKGKTFQLRLYNLEEGQTASYRSSKPAVATVDEAGKVTAISIGKAVIYATVTDAEKNTVKKLQCNITVGPAATGIMFTSSEVSLLVGQKLTLDRIIFPLNTVEKPVFSSLNENIVSVSAGGKVTAKSEGSTIVFAEIDNGNWHSCKVVVSVPEDELLPEEIDLDLRKAAEANEAPSNDELNSMTDSQKAVQVDDFGSFLEKLNAN